MERVVESPEVSQFRRHQPGWWMFGFPVCLSPLLLFQSIQDPNINCPTAPARREHLILHIRLNSPPPRSHPHLNSKPLQVSPTKHFQTTYDTPPHPPVNFCTDRVIGLPEVGRVSSPPAGIEYIWFTVRLSPHFYSSPYRTQIPTRS